MKCNITPLDAAIRCGVGWFLIITPLLNLHTYPFSLLGIIPVITGLVGYCPLYGAVRVLLPARHHGSSTLAGR